MKQLCVFLVAVSALAARTALPQSGTTCVLKQSQKLTHLPAQLSNHFGYDVDVSASQLFASANYAQVTVQGQGIVDVFDLVGNTFVLAQQLVAADPTTGAQFGTAIAASGATLVSGAPSDDSSAPDAGSVYVFDRLGSFWWQTSKIIPPSLPANANAGRNVDIDGNRIIVAGQFTVWIYERTGATWSLVYTLPINNVYSVAISGDNAVVGTPTDNGNTGSVTWLRRVANQWQSAGKVAVSGLQSGGQFGCAVDLDGNSLAVGASQNSAKTAYAFTLTGQQWGSPALLTPSDAASDEWFGTAISVKGNRIAVTAPLHDIGVAQLAGAAYVFEYKTAWSQSHKVVASDPQQSAQLGRAIALSDSYVVIGAPFHSASGTLTDTGAVYVSQASRAAFFLPYGAGCPGSGGFTPALTMDGCPAPSGAVTLGLSNGLGGSLAIVLFSFMQSNIQIPNGCSLLVDPVLPPTITLPLFGTGGGAGAISITGAFPPGLSGYSFSMQAFCADPANSWGYSATNGLTATVPP